MERRAVPGAHHHRGEVRAATQERLDLRCRRRQLRLDRVEGGAPSHPDWYRNLVANPTVQVQVNSDVFTAVARTSEGPERERLWLLMTAIWPSYDEYRGRTDRHIPVVVLERSI